MEFKFEKKVCPCLRWAACEVQSQEQTQEVKLADSMPDVGRVLACWGQPILRSKEWRGDGMTAGGGVMTWTLYAPEDGTEPRCVESWIPFQLKWSFPPTEREGTMAVSCRLRSADARSVSARKLMVRVCVSALGEAMEPWEAEVCAAGELPEDIQVLQNTYPMELPLESGEKSFLIDEDLPWEGNLTPGRMIRYELRPQIQEQQILGDRMVFRGIAKLHLLYRNEDGEIGHRDFEVPISQFVDLDKNYGEEASVHITPAVTSLELEPEDGRLRLKAGLVAQYVIFDRYLAQITEDAYSPSRAVEVQEQPLRLPAMLDCRQENVRMQQSVPCSAEKILDCCYLPDFPVQRRSGEEVSVELPGIFQLLYLDENGSLGGSSTKCNHQMSISADHDASVQLRLGAMGAPQAAIGGEGIQVTGDYPLICRTMSGKAVSMVTGLEAGEMAEPDPGRPSLILRRNNEQGLWNLAKASGSTMEAIRQANKLTGEPEMGRLLLIPVP